MSNAINITLPKGQFFALALLHTKLIRCYEVENDHEALLYQHMIELEAMFNEKATKEQKNYGFRLSSAQALAFVQIWQRCRVIADHISDVILNEILQDIDRKAKQAAIGTAQRALPSPNKTVYTETQP